MRGFLFGSLFFLGLISLVVAEDSNAPLQTLQARFDTGTIAEKIDVLKESTTYPAAVMTPLYERALQYLIDSPTLLRGNASGDELARTAFDLVTKAKDAKAANAVWRAFELATNSGVRAAALETLSVIGESDPTLPRKLDDWLAGENVLHQSGSAVDVAVIDASVRIIGRLGNASSFGVLFSTMTEGYGGATEKAVRDALASIKGDRTKLLEEVIARNRWIDRPSALAYAMADEALSKTEKARIATDALEVALGAPASDTPSLEAQQKLLEESTVDLGALGWAPSAALMIAALNRAIDAYAAKHLPATDLIRFIDAVGATDTHEAAVRLTLYLDLANSEVKRGQPYDEGVVIAVIDNLGRLGDPVAFGDLMAVRYLDYSPAVKEAAQGALGNLGS